MRKIFLRSHLGDESENNMNRMKFVQSRLKLVEKYLPELGKALFDYTEKNAKCRDSGDKVAITLENYSKAEDVTATIKLQLSDFANIIFDIGTNKDAQVQAMEDKVLEQLNEHDKHCKLVQKELKSSITAAEKEKIWFRQLKRTKENHPKDQQQISLAEAEFLKARGESFRSSKSLEEQIDIFERQRLNILKEALLAWTVAELHYHSQALQLFTDAYRIAADIDVNSDLEEFRNRLKSTEPTPRSDSLQRSESILHLITLPFQRQTKFTGSGIPHPSTSSSSNSSQPSEFPNKLLKLNNKGNPKRS